MTNETLKGLKVAILVTDGFEQVELERPRKALDEAGAQSQIVSPKAERVRAWKFREWGDQLRVDVPLDQAKPQEFDALLLPGGLVNLDALRVQPKAMAFAKAFFDAGKPVAAICRGPWTITEINAADDLVFVAQDRSRERWSGLGGSGGRCRPQSGHGPQSQRHPYIQSGNDQGVQRRPSAAACRVKSGRTRRAAPPS
jgi:hypothetical protein